MSINTRYGARSAYDYDLRCERCDEHLSNKDRQALIRAKVDETLCPAHLQELLAERKSTGYVPPYEPTMEERLQALEQGVMLPPANRRVKESGIQEAFRKVTEQMRAEAAEPKDA